MLATASPPRRRSSTDTRLIEAIRRFKTDHDLYITIASDSGDRAGDPGFDGALSLAQQLADASRENLHRLLVDAVAPVYGGNAYVARLGGRIEVIGVRVLD